jgi:hypothetical protein
MYKICPNIYQNLPFWGCQKFAFFGTKINHLATLNW